MQSGLTSSGTGLAGADPDFRQYIFRMTAWNLSSPVLKEGLVQSPGISVFTDLKSYYIFITWWAIIWYKGWIRLKITDCCTICFTGVHRNTHQHAIESLQASLETEVKGSAEDLCLEMMDIELTRMEMQLDCASRNNSELVQTWISCNSMAR